MLNPKLLLLDDDARFRKALAEDFKDKGYQVTEADNLKEIKNLFFDYAVLDLRLLGESGLQAIPELKKTNPQCRIVMLTGYGSVATAVEAVKLGALNYLQKPISCDILEKAFKDQLKTTDELPEQIAPLDKHEHEYIEFVLTNNDGNITRTAQQLGLHRQSLQRKLKKFP